MDALRSVVNWSEEVRKFLEERVREIEQEVAVRELEELIEKLPEVPRGTVTRYVREDRDSN
ncbi:MAG: CopG family transcriptional regulator [Crenarchaeota archaeon]|nr:CopG family transcriptional regulator [Thermoproteota archaeon]